MDYKPFFIQKLKNGSSIRDTKDWNIWVKNIPFKVFPDMKDIQSRSWLDENGDDEFLPDKPTYKAYEIDCEFVYIGDYLSANNVIRDFLKYLAEDGMFSFYDRYSQIGRTNVRYVSNNENVLYRREGQNDIVVFKVTLKMNDPLTEISRDSYTILSTQDDYCLTTQNDELIRI